MPIAVPWSGRDSMRSFPLWSSTKRWAKVNPNPKPCCSNNARLNCMYAPNDLICSAVIPRP